ncbi:MAG: hypothetical protein HMLKMBBP_01586 [Planctomycetes bacterium]|nr:hypothetical protein [Planctomycetota bacterium]
MSERAFDEPALPPATERRPGRALAAVLLVYTMVGVLLVTLAPFEFRIPGEIRVAAAGGAFELLVNCALLAAPGFLLRAVTGANRDVYCLVPLLAGIAAASLIEGTQILVGGRCFSPLDIAANAAGAWAGAMCHDSLRRVADERMAGRMLLDLPLTGLLYLMVPLLWLNGFASIGHDRRIALAVPLALFGAVVIASLWRHRLQPVRAMTAWGASFTAGAWFAAAAAPMLRKNPDELAALSLAAFAATRTLTAVPVLLDTGTRRFEIPTLLRAAPFFVAYLVVLAGWPFTAPSDAWRGELLLAQIGRPPELVELARLLEWTAAFTLAGYMATEAWTRRETRGAAAVLRGAAIPVALAAALECARGWHPETKASLLRGALGASGAVFGAVVYSLQSAAVLEWLARAKSIEARGPVTARDALLAAARKAAHEKRKSPEPADAPPR